MLKTEQFLCHEYVLLVLLCQNKKLQAIYDIYFKRSLSTGYGLPHFIINFFKYLCEYPAYLTYVAAVNFVEVDER